MLIREQGPGWEGAPPLPEGWEGGSGGVRGRQPFGSTQGPSSLHTPAALGPLPAGSGVGGAGFQTAVSHSRAACQASAARRDPPNGSAAADRAGTRATAATRASPSANRRAASRDIRRISDLLFFRGPAGRPPWSPLSAAADGETQRPVSQEKVRAALLL